MSPSRPVSVRSRVPFRLQTRGSTSVLVTIVSFANLRSGLEHIAIVSGEPRNGCIVRIHSECLTGDVFGSARCDCGAQLSEGVDLIGRHGGAILYMRQEGRGIGLYEKLEAYLLQDQGVDTFAANQALGRGADERDYVECAEMMRALGLEAVRLVTNNPAKSLGLAANGILVMDTIPTGVHMTPENRRYLHDKASIAGHRLSIENGHA
jgi:GTP cyclohydrolase II